MKVKELGFNAIGDTIRNLRRQANLTVAQLEELSGVARRVISKLENGETKHPDFETVHMLGSALSMPYTEIVKLYITVETRADHLMTVLKESVLEAPSLCADIAKRFLRDDRKDSYELVDELYAFVETINDRTVQLSLFKCITSHSRLHGIQNYYAKALLQEYLIERDDFQRLRNTYDVGKYILDYVQFLTQEEKAIFYYKLGVHAYYLNKFQEAVKSFDHVETLGIKDDEKKAWVFLLSCSCYIFLGDLDIAELYLAVSKEYDFPFVKENTEFMRGQLDIKQGYIHKGILELQRCLEKMSYKINAVNILFDLHLQRKEWNAIEKLITQEYNFIDLQISKPIDIAEHAAYYETKGKYYGLQNSLENQAKYLFKSATLYAKIDMHEKVYDCFQVIYGKVLSQEIHEKTKILFKEFRQYSNRGVSE